MFFQIIDKLKQVSILQIFFLFFLFVILNPQGIRAETLDSSLVGMHILSTHELARAKEVLEMQENDQQWHFVTIPFTLDDLEKKQYWQKFFNQAKSKRVIPLVRLATRVEGSGWIVPTHRDIVNQLTLLSSLDWPTQQRHIIIFNEVNHANEWGGTINPVEYAQLFRFTSKWAKTENKDFVILPAAMDLDAPNGPGTMEAFTYLEQMRVFDPDIFLYADFWNSHSYPNPAFSASPYQTGKNSVWGFLHELSYLKRVTGKQYQVFITETGWELNELTRPRLRSYYQYAVNNIWSNTQVVAVTPFVLQGSPGPFSKFSFLDELGQPTAQYWALRMALE